MERLILADESLAEIGFLDFDIDLELGDSNDFVIMEHEGKWNVFVLHIKSRHKIPPA